MTRVAGLLWLTALVLVAPSISSAQIGGGGSIQGTVLDTCETAILQKGRNLHAKILAEAVARRVEAAEKKGRRSAPAPAVGPRKTGGVQPANS